MGNQLFLLVLLLLPPLLLTQNSSEEYLPMFTYEVNALNNISTTLQVKPPRIYDINSCRREDRYDGIVCRCDFTLVKHNSTTKFCRIQHLSFRDRGLKGTISPEVGSLLYLTKIDLSGNELTGLIPTTLNKLKYLETLDLSSNQLRGTIPDDIGNMISLQLM